MFWNRPLTQETILPYAAVHYYNPIAAWTDFLKDFNLYKRINFHFEKIHTDESFKSFKLGFNYIIMFGNSFLGNSLGRLGFFFIEREYHSELYTMLAYIKRLPKYTYETDLDKLSINNVVIKFLKQI